MADCPSFSNARQTVKGGVGQSQKIGAALFCFYIFSFSFDLDFEVLPIEQAEERVIYVGLSVRTV